MLLPTDQASFEDLRLESWDKLLIRLRLDSVDNVIEVKVPVEPILTLLTERYRRMGIQVTLGKRYVG